MIAFVALHQIVLVRMHTGIKNKPTEKPAISLDTSVAVELLRACGAAIERRAIKGLSFRWLVESVVMLLVAVMPADR